jgi:hypothetical protein
MKEFIITCLYCGHIFKKIFYYKPDFESLRCEKCDDRNLKIKEFEKIDYYE